LKILHVTESYGGGVTSAINSYVKHSLQYEHYLFGTARQEDLTGEEVDDVFTGIEIVSRNFLSIFKLYLYIYKIKPDVIHVHSSIAGFLLRVLPFINKNKIAYTPHAYAFLRNDNIVKLEIYRWIERMLSFRCRVVAACSCDEGNIAKLLNHQSDVVELINVSGNLPHFNKNNNSRNKQKIGMVGRICPQKGVEFFANVAASIGGVADFIWVGDGSEYGKELLINSGVQVTGWKSRVEVLELVSDLDLYFYTAAWDGFPVSVLEAANYSVPILLRSIGPFEAEDLYTVTSEYNACEYLNRFISGDSLVCEKLKNVSEQINNYHSSNNLSCKLTELYSRFG
jgi:glycosyltransferase involved in cell wall biosynthesis